MYTGSSAFPNTTNPSNPANFSSGPKLPPLLESNMVPVSGDLETVAYRPEVGQVVPVRGPAANTRIFSEESGSTPGFTKS